LVSGFRKYESAKIQVIGVRRRPLLQGELLFAPLTFLPFRGSDLLRGSERHLNANHPFAAWLIEKAPALAQRFPGIIRAVRTNLVDKRSLYGFNAREAAESIATLLERLSQLAPDLRLAKAFYPTLADFPSND
jgi:hypothetical protein